MNARVGATYGILVSLANGSPVEGVVMATLIKELTPIQDKSVREHLADLARIVRKRYHASTYQGQFENVLTGETFGDRLQVGATVTSDGIRTFLIANLLVSRGENGACYVRVSSWQLEGKRTLVAQWVALGISAKGRKVMKVALDVKLTPSGFVERQGSKYVPVSLDKVSGMISGYLTLARKSVERGENGTPLQIMKGYSPSNPNYGKTYSTAESHLVPFGGESAVMKALYIGEGN